MRYLFGFIFLIAGLLAVSQGASAQDATEAATAETIVQKPATSSEPAPQEPALKLELDSAGVNLAPGPPGADLDKTKLRVRRSRIALQSTAAVTVVGVALFGAGVARSRSAQGLNALSRENSGLLLSGMAIMIGGAIGMIASGAVLGFGKGELRRLEQARHERRHRAHWDLAQSRLVF